jgi:hypothetical protein
MSITADGRGIVADCLSYQLPLEFVIRQGQAALRSFATLLKTASA